MSNSLFIKQINKKRNENATKQRNPKKVKLINMSTEAIIGVILGVLFRTMVPFLNKLKKNPEIKFDKKFLIPAFASLILSVPAVIILLGTIKPSGNPWVQFTSSFAIAYTTQDIAREAQKLREK